MLEYQTSTEFVSPTAPALVRLFGAGTKVYVRNRFLGWSEGFEVADFSKEGYWLRRLSDGRVLPEALPYADVRLERRQNPSQRSRRSFIDRSDLRNGAERMRIGDEQASLWEFDRYARLDPAAAVVTESAWWDEAIEPEDEQPRDVVLSTSVEDPAIEALWMSPATHFPTALFVWPRLRG